jgi:DNA-binding winged helix-turn-helix (wHTH) protein
MADRSDELRTPSPPFRVGDWLVEPAQDTIRCGESVRHLEPKVMDALVALARRAGEVLSKAELTDAVWQVPFISENRLVGVIAELRRAFDDDVHAPRYVETVPTRGYRLAPPVEWMGGDPAPEPGRESHFLIETADHTYRLREGANIIGREAEVDVCIASEWVSRRHARLQVDGDHAVLEDLGSKNGTLVNGARLSGPVRLHDGDEIRLGRGVVVLRFSSALVATRTESGGASEAP